MVIAYVNAFVVNQHVKDIFGSHFFYNFNNGRFAMLQFRSYDVRLIIITFATVCFLELPAIDPDRSNTIAKLKGMCSKSAGAWLR